MLSSCLVCLATANSPYFPSIFHAFSHLDKTMCVEKNNAIIGVEQL